MSPSFCHVEHCAEGVGSYMHHKRTAGIEKGRRKHHDDSKEE
jgi:hypothetical protein